MKYVSIHAPLARSNLKHLTCEVESLSFNTCSSCEEQLGRLICILRPRFRFNTCSSCEEQPSSWGGFKYCCCFNTCSSCEEQLADEVMRRGERGVSIHAPLARSNSFVISDSLFLVFQYMLLLRGATVGEMLCLLRDSVSIHAPLARSNSRIAELIAAQSSFNTCSSCEEQHNYRNWINGYGKFQYMLLLRGATGCQGQSEDAEEFQYMLLLRGATHGAGLGVHLSLCFNTCSSCEEQRSEYCSLFVRGCFNTCSSCEEQQES